MAYSNFDQNSQTKKAVGKKKAIEQSAEFFGYTRRDALVGSGQIRKRGSLECDWAHH